MQSIVSRPTWKEHGFASATLEHLLAACGLFYDALACLLERARRKAVRVWAEQSPFELREVLKRRNYRWNDGTDGRPKSWYVDLQEQDLATEFQFLQNEIYQRETSVYHQEFTALDLCHVCLALHFFALPDGDFNPSWQSWTGRSPSRWTPFPVSFKSMNSSGVPERRWHCDGVILLRRRALFLLASAWRRSFG